MDFLNNIISRDPDYSRMLSCVKSGKLPIAASGLSQIHKAVVTSALYRHTEKKILLITHDEASASLISGDLKSLGVNALLFPSRDYNLARLAGFSREYEHKRIQTLSKVIDGDFGVLVASVDSCLQYTLPMDVLKNSIIELECQQTVSMSDISEKLVSIGYTKSELTEGAGQFSIRGSIIDVFPANRNYPIRIDLWGDDIDSLSEFDPISQRRIEEIKSVKIYPAREIICDDNDLCTRLKKYLGSSDFLTDKQRSVIEKDVALLEGGTGICADVYIPLLYPKNNTVFDYAEGCITVICESANIAERMKSIQTQHSQDIENLLEDGFITEKTSKLWLDSAEFSKFTGFSVFLESFPRSVYNLALKEIFSFNFKRSTPWSGDVSILAEDIEYITRLGGIAVILAGENKAAKVLADELCARGINALYLENSDAIKDAGVYVISGGLSGGIEIPSLKFLLITHRFISSDTTRRIKRPKNSKEIGSLDELKPGDYVVHSTHGIGIFDGINRITTSSVTKDYIKIKYLGTDVLYVPVTQLDLVSKYIGASQEGGIRLNKLGSDSWQKTRSRVKSALKDMAKQLTALYAKRMSAKGYAFSPDTDLQNNFERRFEYEETEDQLRCIGEIKSDMEREIPMDRLLCGDVGFGKTEVALRAAFKCISDGKQCALMVPTTILAMQHYNTIIRRFADMPVTVKLLNRFVSKSEQQRVISGLKSGSVDMVVGTHRLISKDVTFKDIGLVIIDEEQRFGVAQKERLKELYPFVDILTLSATPIPRTLNMAMSGLRDMSSIDEAPGDRHPVQTYVLEQNTGVIIDAINKELRRSGQVYYLHNRVESITACAMRLKEKIPQATIGIAHGQMSEDELSQVWQRLVDHEIDILVCTTIIETGIDVPNANTLIIENADKMGLSQLHQLRGRVGRSPRRAYAYFCFSPMRTLSEVAQKRLEAIREFTEFGSGFKIALRDLEIRGAGSILGGEQHGNMEAVGYDMYLKLLSDAVNEENGVKPEQEEPDCTVDLNISAHIPESYIASLPARLGIYKRIADIKTTEDSSDVIDELIDRFGEPPRVVIGLINIALLRSKAAKCGITEISQTPAFISLKTDSVTSEAGARLAAAFGNRFNISASGTPKYIIRTQKGENITSLITKLAETL